jgi:putative endonuclease
VYVESTSNPRDAIAREKQIKSWTRAKKLALIAASNPTRADLAAGWFETRDGVTADSSLRSE